MTDQEDFSNLVAEYGFDEATIRRISENTSDMTELLQRNYKFIICNSLIAGLGISAIDYIETYEVIGPARLGGKRTVLGRYTNHAIDENAIMRFNNNGDIELIAISDIQPNSEITVDYRQVNKLKAN